MIRAVLVPGFNGTSRQPLLVALTRELRAAGIHAKAITLKAGRPTAQLAPEVAQLRKAAQGAQVLVGRSFGGRVCARLAIEVPPRALVLLGFPIRPPGKLRPLDEAALKALACPTLILQGANDALGAPALLKRLIAGNPRVRLEVVAGAGHSYGKQQAAVLARATQWLVERLCPPQTE